MPFEKSEKNLYVRKSGNLLNQFFAREPAPRLALHDTQFSYKYVK